MYLADLGATVVVERPGRGDGHPPGAHRGPRTQLLLRGAQPRSPSPGI
ncbi:MAG: hypothetical protein U0Q10_06515 [Dermatophilaceae bacterium]